MIYIESICFPDGDEEFDYIIKIKETCYNSYYPFKVLSAKGFERIDFEPVTILYGGNGSGKTTVLNIIAQKFGLNRGSVYNCTNFFDAYVDMCQVSLKEALPESSAIITSDDVFDYMLNIRNLNQGIHQKRKELFGKYLDTKYAAFQMTSLADYEQLKEWNLAQSKSKSEYVREKVMDNVREFSNGESAFHYFTNKIQENAVYLLDEPENSLSAARQVELSKFLEDSARYFNCQFVISTHSPFLLAMKQAKIYDMDADPVDIKPWINLPAIKTYYEFFQKHKEEFL